MEGFFSFRVAKQIWYRDHTRVDTLQHVFMCSLLGGVEVEK